MDWSSDNILYAALNNKVYSYNPIKKLPTKLLSISKIKFGLLDDTPATIHNQGANYVTSLKWLDEPNLLAIGTSNNKIILWDLMIEKCVSLIHDHDSRVASLASNRSILTSGSHDGRILNHDIRVLNRSAISSYLMHESEVCGLKWSKNGRYLCSGSSILCSTIFEFYRFYKNFSYLIR
jgi:cell division cycle 20, cofactor of APC complex